ncbi:peptidylprolyl isomerase [candidate division KSB1 bacterium]
MKVMETANAAGKTLFVSLAIMIGLFLITGCGGEPGVQSGDTVQVEYKGTLDDGSVFDESQEGQPLSFIAGMGQVIPGFDNMVLGMKLNEEKTETIPFMEAYGAWDSTRVMNFPRDQMQLPETITLEKGMTLPLQNNQGQMFPAIVLDFNDEILVLDMNSPLAGKDLTFAIKIVGITTPEK